MSEEHNKADNSANQMGLEDLSQIFAPSWARQTQDSVVVSSARYDRDDDRSPRGGNRGRNGDRGDRPPRRDGDRRPPRREDGDRPARRDNADRPPRRDGDRRPPRHDGERRNTPPPPKPLEIDVRFMPAGKALASIIRRIQATHRAYPIRDIVKLFQNDDSSMAVRIEATGAEPSKLYQCRLCGMPALTEEEVVDHLFKKHIQDFFDIEEVEGEAPAGNFTCVAKCGLTGELLGPPNHHSYARKVQEMLHDRFPGMSEEDYRRHIEMVRDPEAVEQWREQSRKKLVYRRKSTEDEAAKTAAEGEASAEAPAETPEEKPMVPGLERHEAELLFRREIMPEQIGAATHIVCPATSLQNLPNRRLAAELSARFAEESNPNRRFTPHQQGENAGSSQKPRNGSLFTAVHAAFHHRGLYFFRAVDDRGQEFVMATQPAPLDTEHATPELREIAQYVTDNPSCPPKQLIQALNPDNDEEKTKRIISQVKWLVEKGHLVEFFNGFLSPPASHPIFKANPPKPKEVKQAPKTETKVEPVAEPVAEAPAEPATETAEEPAVEAPAETQVADAQAQQNSAPAEAPAESQAESATPATENA